MKLNCECSQSLGDGLPFLQLASVTRAICGFVSYPQFHSSINPLPCLPASMGGHTTCKAWCTPAVQPQPLEAPELHTFGQTKQMMHNSRQTHCRRLRVSQRFAYSMMHTHCHTALESEISRANGKTWPATCPSPRHLTHLRVLAEPPRLLAGGSPSTS